MRILINIFLLIPLSVLTVACADMEYMDRSSFTKVTGEDTSRKHYRFGPKGPRHYGAFLVKKETESDENLNIDEKNTFVALKRQKSRMYAETQLFEAKNKDKSYFDQTFVDFGVDRKSKAMSFNLTLKY